MKTLNLNLVSSEKQAALNQQKTQDDVYLKQLY